MFKKLFAPLLVVAMLALPACGSSKKVSPTLKYVPASTESLVVVNNPYSWSAAEKDRAFSLIKVANAQKDATNFDQYLDNATRSITDGSEGFIQDVKPWIGNSMAIATLEAVKDESNNTNAGMTGDLSNDYMPQPLNPRLLIVEVKDAKKAQEYATNKVKGYDVAIVKNGMFFLTSTDSWCPSCSEEEMPAKAKEKLEEFAKGKEANSVLKSPDFTRLSNHVSPSGDAVFFGETEGTTIANPIYGLIGGGSQAKEKKKALMSLDMQASAAKMDIAIQNIDEQDRGNASEPELMNGLPADTLFAVDARNVNKILDSRYEATSDPNNRNQLVTLVQALGIDPSKDLEWMNGETVLAGSDVISKDIGLVSKVADEKPAVEFVNKVVTRLRSLKQNVVEVGSNTYSLALSPVIPDFTMGVTNGRFIMAARKPYFDVLARKADKPLSSTPAYKRFIASDQKTLIAMYGQPDELANKFASLITDAKMRDLLGQMDSMGVQARVDGDVVVASGVMNFVAAT